MTTDCRHCGAHIEYSGGINKWAHVATGYVQCVRATSAEPYPKPITVKQLSDEIAAVVEPYGLTLAIFLATDLADIEDDKLRDLWLMVKGALLPPPFTESEEA